MDAMEPETRKPETITGTLLAAFLRGLFPETSQFERQIADIEDQARNLPPRAGAEDTFAALWTTMAQEHAEPHDRCRCDGCAVLRAVHDDRA